MICLPSLGYDYFDGSGYNYAEVDVLSSNFNLSEKWGDGLFGRIIQKVNIKDVFFNAIGTTKFGFWNHLGLIGLRAYQMFWGKTTDFSRGLSLVLEGEEP